MWAWGWGNEMVLHFNEDGLLPPGDHEMTFAELRDSILVRGPGDMVFWDSQWRSHLVNNLEVMVGQLLRIGISSIFINGSFTEERDHPGDIDGYFEVDVHRMYSGNLERELNAIDPLKAWGWSLSSRYGTLESLGKPKLPMWHRYRVELFPHAGQLSGLKDQHGHSLTFPAAFRKRKTDDKPKGIVKLKTGAIK